MTGPTRPSPIQIQDHIDGRLTGRDRIWVATYLLEHPEIASEVETLRRQNEALKTVGREVLEEPIPERLRRIVRSAAGRGSNASESPWPRRLLTVVSAILLVALPL